MFNIKAVKVQLCGRWHQIVNVRYRLTHAISYKICSAILIKLIQSCNNCLLNHQEPVTTASERQHAHPADPGGAEQLSTE